MRISCSSDEVQSLTAEDIKTLLGKDKHGEYMLLDVRQPEEHEAPATFQELCLSPWANWKPDRES